jgi:hypothetical protein
MSAPRIATALIGLLLMCSSVACRDVGLVGEGSECSQSCPSDQRCASGMCVPLRGGDAGDDFDRFDEGPGGHDDRNDHHGDSLPDGHSPGPND